MFGFEGQRSRKMRYFHNSLWRKSLGGCAENICFARDTNGRRWDRILYRW